MIINKVLNNNVVTIISENSEEAVVMGRGIAFQKKKGDEIDESKIEKIFVLENKSINEKLLTLVNDIPAKYLEVAENIIKYAENKLGTKLNENIYLTLTDHISFAISRAEKNLEIKNAMFWDIKRLHKVEFEIGIHALKIIEENLNFELPEDEAASIAMHILNGELDQEMPEIVDMIKLIEEMGIGHYPVCIAKTQYSFSADPKVYGAVDNFELHIKDIVINNGAEMIVAIAGEILRMPGLPKEPQALHIDIVDGEIEGLS